MSKKIEISIDGKKFPCRATMGAMLRFKRETGKEIGEIKENDLSLLCTWLWCCVASSSKHDGVDFPYSLMDFADGVTPELLMEWQQALASGDPSDPQPGEVAGKG